MMTNQHGLGLPELLIALLLASFTTMVLMRHYLNTKQQYRYIQAGLEQSIELQLVTDLIRDSIRRAGFTPCSGIDHLITIDQRGTHQKLVAIELSQNGEPSLKMNRMSEHFNTILQLVSPTELLTDNYHKFHNNQAIIIADCYHAEVQNISQLRYTAVGQSITIAQPLAFTYHGPIYVGEWLEETYSIHHPHTKGRLFYDHHHAEELTTAIHNLAARIELYNGRTLLQVTLELDDAHQSILETMLRTH